MALDSVKVGKCVKTDKRKKHKHFNSETKNNEISTDDSTDISNMHKDTKADVDLIDDIGDCNMFDCDFGTW